MPPSPRGVTPMKMLVVLAVLASATTSLGGGHGEKPKRHYFYRAEVLVYVKGIAEELKLTKEAFDQARTVVDQVADKHQADLDKALAGAKDGTEAWHMALKKLVDDTDKALAKVLTPAQMERLAQILRQRYVF